MVGFSASAGRVCGQAAGEGAVYAEKTSAADGFGELISWLIGRICGSGRASVAKSKKVYILNDRFFYTLIRSVGVFYAVFDGFRTPEKRGFDGGRTGRDGVRTVSDGTKDGGNRGN